MEAIVNSGGQSMVAERFRFGLHGLGLDSLLLHCLIRQENLFHFVSIAQVHKSVLAQLLLVIKPWNRLLNFPTR